jgi:hypothetical protein
MKSFIVFIFFFSFFFCFSQQNIPCGTSSNKNNISNIIASENAIKTWISQNNNKANSSVITIPTVVHIIYNHPLLNIPDTQVIAQINSLNIDLRKLNADTTNIPSVFKQFASDTKIQLCLAQRTPDNLPTNGIIHKYSSVTTFFMAMEKYNLYGGDDAWDNTRYFNIWVTPPISNYLGYAVFPSLNSQFTDYGISVKYSEFKRGGRIVNHELGHALNLFHLWGYPNCGEDSVSDTPFQGYYNYGCPVFPFSSQVSNNLCPIFSSNLPNGDMFMNYMDYTPSTCQNMFTIGQAQRMNATINTMLPELILSNGCQPIISLANDASIDAIYNIPPRSCQSSFNTVLKLRNRATSPLNNIQIVYSFDNSPANLYNWNGNLNSYDTSLITLPVYNLSPGVHEIMVYCKNPNTSADLNLLNDTLKFNFVNYSTGLPLPYFEGFEGNNFPPNNCTIKNTDLGYSFQKENFTTAIGCTDNYCLRLDNRACIKSYPEIEQYCVRPYDELILPNINLSSSSLPILTFQHSYNNFLNSGGVQFTDTLEVLISTDCGMSYTSLFQKQDSLLCTSYPFSGAHYFPSNTNEWRIDTISLSSYNHIDNAMLKFRVKGYHSGYGNNIFIDDINISNSVGVKELDVLKSIKIRPNPTNKIVLFESDINGLKVEVVDMLGKQIEVNITKYEFNKWKLDFQNVEVGAYFIKMSNNENTSIKKVILIK